MIEEMLRYNEKFVENREYEKYAAGKLPKKKTAILTCMDTRLVKLLPAALGISDGDVKMIKNAGAVIPGPFDSAVRSILVAVVELGVENVMVIGHTDCGVSKINGELMTEELVKRGVSRRDIEMLRYGGVDIDGWLRGFDCVESSVSQTVDMLREHPLIPKDVSITGYVMDTETGRLTPVC